jgi:hypothetical protein
MPDVKLQIAGESDDDTMPACSEFGTSRRRPKSRTASSGELCYACLQPDDLCAMYRGHAVHSDCGLGIRAYIRVIKDNPEEMKNEKVNCAKNPDVWREDIAEFLDPSSRKGAILTKRISMEHREEKFNAESRIVDDKDMTKKNYKKFMAEEESMSDDEASQNFDAEVDRQEVKLMNKRGRPVVSVPDFDARIRREEGTRTSTVKVTRDASPTPKPSPVRPPGHTYLWIMGVLDNQTFPG